MIKNNLSKNNEDKSVAKQKVAPYQMSCALHGSNACPKPKECDGITRRCTDWLRHSGR